MTNIIIFSGSDRKGSFNTQFAQQAQAYLQNKGLNTQIVNYENLPLLSQNTEFPTPEEVSNLRSTVGNADAVLFVTPEYNGSYPARVKNLVDWLSRAVELGSQDPTVLRDKKVAVASVANSTYGKFVRGNLITLLKYVYMNVMEGEGLGLRIPAEAWGSGELVLDEEQQQSAHTFLDEFANFAA